MSSKPLTTLEEGFHRIDDIVSCDSGPTTKGGWQERYMVHSGVVMVRNFFDGQRSSEEYYWKNKLISRRQYEERRQAFPGLPPSSGGVPDLHGSLRGLTSRRNVKGDGVPTVQSTEAESGDAFCETLLQSGTDIRALDDVHVYLGERNAVTSARLLSSLRASGVDSIWLTEAVRSGPTRADAKGLVIELPMEVERRKRVFRWAELRSKEVGLDPDRDHGQRLLYVRLD